MILNDRPGLTQGLGDSASQDLSKIKLLGENLVAAMQKYGFEEAMKVVLRILLEK